MRIKILFTAFVCFFAAVALVGAKAEAAKRKKVKDGSKVKLHYTLTVEGEVVDSSEGRDPLEFEVGSGQMIPGFEEAVIGMKVGDKKSFEVSPEDGYGPDDPENYQVASKANMPPDLELKVGMVLTAQDSEGKSFPVKIVEVREDSVLLNFNHPLAGKTLEFDVEIVSID